MVFAGSRHSNMLRDASVTLTSSFQVVYFYFCYVFFITSTTHCKHASFIAPNQATHWVGL